MKDRNLFHLFNTIGNIFTCGCATRENITDGVHSMKKNSFFHRKKQISSTSSNLTENLCGNNHYIFFEIGLVRILLDHKTIRKPKVSIQ